MRALIFKSCRQQIFIKIFKNKIFHFFFKIIQYPLNGIFHISFCVRVTLNNTKNIKWKRIGRISWKLRYWFHLKSSLELHIKRLMLYLSNAPLKFESKSSFAHMWHLLLWLSDAQHITFTLNRFSVKYRFTFQNLRFFTAKSPSVTHRSVSQENASEKSNNPSSFFPVKL